MCFPNASVPSVGGAESQTVAAQLKYAPQVYQANAQYSPLYTQLGLKNISSFLNGANGQDGFLSMYGNEILPSLTAANVNNAKTWAPQISASEAAANPMAAKLLGDVGSSAQNELGYGTQLTPAEQVQMRQGVRGGAAARGMGFGPSDVFDESMADTGFGQNLLQERQGAAEGAAGSLENFYGNPTMALLGGSMTPGNVTSTAGGSVAPAMLSEFNPGANDSTVINAGLQSSLQSAGAEDKLIGAYTGAPAEAASSY